MKPTQRTNPARELWYIIGALVAVGVAAKLGVIYCYSKMRKL